LGKQERDDDDKNKSGKRDRDEDKDNSGISLYFQISVAKFLTLTEPVFNQITGITKRKANRE
jgi:hypothetical protein